MAKNLQRRVDVEELNLVSTNHDGDQTVTQSSVIQSDSEGLKTVQEFSFVCLKGKKIGLKIYIFRQVAMREKFNFFPAFLSNANKKFFFFWLRPCSVTSTASGNKATNSRKVVRSDEQLFSSLQKVLVSVFVLTSIETSL